MLGGESRIKLGASVVRSGRWKTHSWLNDRRIGSRENLRTNSDADWYSWRGSSIIRVVGCAENDNISWSVGQLRMNSSGARVSYRTDNWKSLSHISIRRIVRWTWWFLLHPLSSCSVALSLSLSLRFPPFSWSVVHRRANKVTNFWLNFLVGFVCLLSGR